MNIKKTICAALAGAVLMGTSAYARDNIYAYNKFVSMVLGEQKGYCDFTASFVGHEGEYENINDYFSGLISAFYSDIDADYSNELVTVETSGITVYRMGENGAVYLGDIDTDLIANYGDSYANVFTVPEGKLTYIGVEKYSKVANEYDMYLYSLNADTDEFKKLLEIHREDNEDGIEEKVWAADKTFYSYTNGGGIQSSINPDNYADIAAAAAAAVGTVAPSSELTAEILSDRINGKVSGDDFRLNAGGIKRVTYVRATGVRLTDMPMVIFEDNSNLSELRVKPEIVTVTVDGQELQFPVQDPVIIDGTTLVPMRIIFEALGADVLWKDEGGVQTIIASTDDTIINMRINYTEYSVNGEVKTLDVPAQLINDKTMVPIRAVSESLGCQVDWEPETRTVVIRSNT